MSEPRYARQIALFGAEGQEALRNARVAVVGLGGLGSHICQQLAYLGIQHFVLADDDPVEETNLNRLIGATSEDIGLSKLEVAGRLIRSVQPTAEIIALEHKLPHPEIDEALQRIDVVIGAVDNDYPRLLLTDRASQLGLPYIDAATDINTEAGLIYGGRVVVSGPTPGCLSCMHELSQTEIRRAQMNEAQLQEEARIYGVPVEDLRSTGPSVVALNGVVASCAVMEAMVLITGLRPPTKTQNYLGHWGRITKRDEPGADCFYCARWASQGR